MLDFGIYLVIYCGFVKKIKKIKNKSKKNKNICAYKIIVLQHVFEKCFF
jgi:hypothetical protein